MAVVKICGITNQADAELAIELGAEAIGCVVEPTSPRYLSPTTAGQLLSALPQSIVKVLVFGPLYVMPEQASLDFVQFLTDPLNLAGHVSVGQIRAIHLGESIVPTQNSILRQGWSRITYLLEPRVEGRFGGTGQKLDWIAAANFVKEMSFPVLLAGGLTPDNVADAIRTVKPFGVDVSSGVESSLGKKDPGKLRDFIESAKG